MTETNPRANAVTAPVEDPVLADIVRRLSALYHPERIYLFGSHARDEASRDSDYDLMVIVPDDALGFIIVNDLRQLSDKVENLAAKLKVPERVSLLEMLQRVPGLREGRRISL